VLFSPPHYAVTISVGLFHFAQFAVVAAFFNALGPGAVRSRRWLLLLLWSLYIGHCELTDFNWGPYQVRSVLYMVTAAALIPFSLVMIAEYMKDWTAGAKAALLYFGWTILLMQIFPLFSGTAWYGPVYHDIDFMLPPPFPLMLFVPALAVGFVLYKVPLRSALLNYLLAGLVFVVTFTVTNWGTSALQLSEWGDNSFIAGHYPSYVFHETWKPTTTMAFDGLTLGASVLSVALAAVSIWMAVVVGRWVREVIR
jgi:hypothetical protein